MQRRGGGGQSVKGQRSVRLKARKAPTAHASIDGRDELLDQRTHERDEALEQLAATTEILRVIRASPTDAQPVFETIVRSAVSLCGSLLANVFRFDGELLHFGATSGDQSYANLIREKYPMRPDTSQISGRVVLTSSVVWLEDALADPDYDKRYPLTLGWRRVLGVPMLHGADPVGVIIVAWVDPGPASKVQEELLKTFADQAVIAIENVRLFNQVQARTHELSEALQQQTATADVLKVISRSTFDLQAVLDTLVQSAARLCEADHAWLARRDSGVYRVVASFGHAKEEHAVISEFFLQHPFSPGRGTVIGRTALEGRPVHVADYFADPELAWRVDPQWREAQRIGKYRTALGVPLLREGVPIGVLAMSRSSVRPFSDKQIELATTFADQAVIAIENTRLLTELRESLEQQTATSEVLKVISSSPSDLQPVFQSMLENSVRICEAKFGQMFLCE